MGTWGPGLYSDDFAADLRTTVSAVCRLPLSGPELLARLEEVEPAAVMPDDEDYTTFWLVVADQLHRRGIQSVATERAIAIIDDRSNLAMLEELEMSAADLRRRAKALEVLRSRLTAAAPEKRGTTLKRPQELLLHPGEVYAFPIDHHGNVRNPYFGDDYAMDPAGWGCFVVVASGHALEYLAWYQIAPNMEREVQRPALVRALTKLEGAPSGIGTLTRQHMRRMQLELLGTTEPPSAPAPAQPEVIATVAADISLSNVLCRWLQPAPEGQLREALVELAWQHDPRGLGRWRSELKDEYEAWAQTVEDATATEASAEDIAALLTVQYGGSDVDQATLERYAHSAWIIAKLATPPEQAGR